MIINKTQTYIHDEIGHNLKAPSKIVPYIYDLIKPNSVIDLGCGIGTFLKVFKDMGVTNVLGVDGEWTNIELLKKHININEFTVSRLDKPIDLEKKYDLAISLEVAEHIEEKFVDNYVQNVTNASNIILFSAAAPYQGGFNHLNEQWSDYWEQKFKKYDFVRLDFLRKSFWGQPEIDFWYQQNIYLYVHRSELNRILHLIGDLENGFQNAIHPELYLKKAAQLDDIILGKCSYSFYLKLIIKKLLKSTKS